jgi:hypothetical protein
MAFGRQNIAHIYQEDGGNPGWGQNQAWALAGGSPSVSLYDASFAPSDTPFHQQIHQGIMRLFGRLPIQEPTMTRGSRVSAQQNSLPAARFFQGYTGAGTGRSWSGGAVAQGQRMTHQNFNPNAQGAAELHPATTYDPFPSPSSLYPKVV